MSPAPLITAGTYLNYEDAPVADHRFGINSVIDFKGPSDGRWGMGVEIQSVCAVSPMDSLPVDCAPGSPVTRFAPDSYEPTYSTFEARDLVIGTNCMLGNKAANHEHAMRLLNLTEQSALEKMLFDLAIPTAGDAGINAVPGSSGTVLFDDYGKAVGHLLNDWYSSNPQVAPTLFMTADVAIGLGDSIARHGNHLELVTGEKVAVAPGMLFGKRENREEVHQSPNGPILMAIGAPFGFKGVKHVFDVDKLASNKTSTYAHATYLLGYHCRPMYVQFSRLAVSDLPDPLQRLLPGAAGTTQRGGSDPLEYAAIQIAPGLSAAAARTAQLTALNAHPNVGTNGANKPTVAWEAGMGVNVYFYDGNKGNNAVYYWDGAKWAEGYAPKKVLAPTNTYDHPALDSAQARTVDSFGQMFTANPTTAWTGGQYASVDGQHIYWDGRAWVKGEAPGPVAPPVIPSIGVTAGTPGTFTPPGSTPPASLAALKADAALGDTGTAKPGAAWTTGQYVIVGGAHVSWNGTAWVAGDAT